MSVGTYLPGATDPSARNGGVRSLVTLKKPRHLAKTAMENQVPGAAAVQPWYPGQAACRPPPPDRPRRS
jgi:hypothetical protein